MLSRQVSMRIEERLRSAEPEKRQDIKETLQQVAGKYAAVLLCGRHGRGTVRVAQ